MYEQATTAVLGSNKYTKYKGTGAAYCYKNQGPLSIKSILKQAKRADSTWMLNHVLYSGGFLCFCLLNGCRGDREECTLNAASFIRI